VQPIRPVRSPYLKKRTIRSINQGRTLGQGVILDNFPGKRPNA
jgi:hypothetical protein